MLTFSSEGDMIGGLVWIRWNLGEFRLECSISLFLCKSFFCDYSIHGVSSPGLTKLLFLFAECIETCSNDVVLNCTGVICDLIKSQFNLGKLFEGRK